MLIKDKSLYVNLVMAIAFYFGAGVFLALAYRHWQAGENVVAVIDLLLVWVDGWVAHKSIAPVIEHIRENRDGTA